MSLGHEHEAVEVVGDGEFHVWPAKTIDVGIDILTRAKGLERISGRRGIRN